MNINNYKKNNRKKSKVEFAFKVGITSIIILAGTWVVLKISKGILKELEGMGL